LRVKKDEKGIQMKGDKVSVYEHVGNGDTEETI
jgi:hypothetical protein